MRRILRIIATAATLAAPGAQAQSPPRTTAREDTTMRMAAGDTMHGMSMAAMHGPLGVPDNRLGSGTSWLPDASPMHAFPLMAGSWSIMVHGAMFLQSDWQQGPRGGSQLGSVNWAMAMASHDVGRGRLQLRGMLSAEPWTVGAGGYPLLLQSGESLHGHPLHDRQHPHDLFMELAAAWDRPLSPGLAVQVYAAPAGEPAIGPVAFPHRPSAADDPFAPLAHHWMDATHITYGVATVALYSRSLKVEGSVFNGREPDDDRTNFDFRRLDSYAGRVTVNPDAQWSVSASYAYIPSADPMTPGESLHRAGVSVLTVRPLASGGTLAASAIYGANIDRGGRVGSGALVEGTLDTGDGNSFFTRAEYVRKSAADLALDGFDAEREFDVGALTAGYVRALGSPWGLDIGIGAAGTVNQIPAALASTYGGTHPLGAVAFIRLRPRTAQRRHEALGFGYDRISER